MGLMLLSKPQLNTSLDRGNALTYNGIQAIAEALGSVPHLTVLDLRSTDSSKHNNHFMV